MSHSVTAAYDISRCPPHPGCTTDLQVTKIIFGTSQVSEARLSADSWQTEISSTVSVVNVWVKTSRGDPFRAAKPVTFAQAGRSVRRSVSCFACGWPSRGNGGGSVPEVHRKIRQPEQARQFGELYGMLR